MAESYKKSKGKYYQNLRKEDKLKTLPRNPRHKRNNSRDHYQDSKTPPLPSSFSIEDLLKQRESLKEELKKMAKYSESDLKNKYVSNKDDKKHSDDIKVHSRKRHNSKDSKLFKDASPECNEVHMQLDSEDEESIIEQRRKQRRQLLEKFKTDTRKNTTGNDNKTNDNLNNISGDNATDKFEPIISTQLTNKKSTDMFSELDDHAPNKGPDQVTQDNTDNNAQLVDNWDDEEGYYNIKVGDIINNNRYTIKSILGQGVFANVVRAQDRDKSSTEVAIKIIRNNDLMYKTGLKELAILNDIKLADPENRYHCVKIFEHFMHKSHLCIVLEPLYMDLRGILKKYGKSHGINMKALMSYSRQLLLALRLLKKIGIIHADIKPDNILVNEKKNVLKLCDFGSATKIIDNDPTPYLVSRFYRPPEIILGIVPYKFSVDVWSTACTIYEMCTGKIMFTGSSNNKMLKCFMDLKGRLAAKLIRRGKFKDQHFNYNNNFLLHKKDEFTGREKVVEIYNNNATRDLNIELKKSFKNMSGNEEKKLIHLKDLLEKMLILDPSQRISVTECLKHPFIQEELLK